MNKKSQNADYWENLFVITSFSRKNYLVCDKNTVWLIKTVKLNKIGKM